MIFDLFPNPAHLNNRNAILKAVICIESRKVKKKKKDQWMYSTFFSQWCLYGMYECYEGKIIHSYFWKCTSYHKKSDLYFFSSVDVFLTHMIDLLYLFVFK